MQIELKAVGPIDPSELTLSFATRFGSPIRYYDDGIGTLFIMQDSMGIVGIVRAQTWEDAYSIVEDEFLPVVPGEELHEAYGLTKAEYNARSIAVPADDTLELAEGYSYQSNATGSGIVAHDLNGESLDPLTVAEIERLELVVSLA